MTSLLDESLQRDINHIRDKVVEMGKLAQSALKDSLKAVHENNRQLAYYIILRDRYIDELEKEIDRLCQEFLVRHMPVSEQLQINISQNKAFRRYLRPHGGNTAIFGKEGQFAKHLTRLDCANSGELTVLAG